MQKEYMGRLLINQLLLMKTYLFIRTCFDYFSKYQKLPVVYLNIYQRDIGLSKWYQQGYFHFHWLEIQQVREVLEKIREQIGKT